MINGRKPIYIIIDDVYEPVPSKILRKRIQKVLENKTFIPYHKQKRKRR